MAKKTRKRKLSSWNLFVMDVRKKNPGKSFKDILVLASKLKKQGAKMGDYVKDTTEKAVKKIGRTAKKLGKRRRRRKGRKSKKN